IVERGGLGFENNVHIVPRGVLFIGNTDKTLLVHLLNSFHFAAGGSDLGRDLIYRLLESFFFGGRFKYEQAFVSFHFSFPSVSAPSTGPLNWFMAFCIPATNQHSAW